MSVVMVTKFIEGSGRGSRRKWAGQRYENFRPISQFGDFRSIHSNSNSGNHTTSNCTLKKRLRNYEEITGCKDLGLVVQKLINANPGLKFNWSIYFSFIRPFFTAYILCSLSLVKSKTEG